MYGFDDVPQIGSCNIAEPTRTDVLVVFDSRGLELVSWSGLGVSCSTS